MTLASGDDSTHDSGFRYACGDSLLSTPLCCDSIHEFRASCFCLSGGFDLIKGYKNDDGSILGDYKWIWRKEKLRL
nr:hypothetical protein [Tanacetum cinerariifolium]